MKDPSTVTSPSRLRQLGAWLGDETARLYPGCFALVMATGIISNALFFQGRRGWSDALFAVNGIAYPWLMLLTALRIAWFRKAIWSDLINPRLVYAFLTFVAGTDVLGVGLNLRGYVTVALTLWLFALIAWLFLIYFGFGVLSLLNTADGADVVHGGWLIAIVATESLVILGSLVAPALGELGETAFVLIHMLWGLGLGLYGIFIALFAYRVFFFDLRPDDVTPVLWVIMGAAAISTNAGSTLILTDSGMPFLHSMRPFIHGVTLIMWAWATWWIPLLLLLGIWKHGVRREPLTYTPMLWSLVFPLGMYALASLRLSLAADFPPLAGISHAMIWVALAAWAAAFAGFVMSCWRSFREFGHPDNLRASSS
jgi:tellurite resistance protein TehA-like permease